MSRLHWDFTAGSLTHVGYLAVKLPFLSCEDKAQEASACEELIEGGGKAFLVVLLCPAKTPRSCSGRRIGNIHRLCSQAGGVCAVIGNGTRASECRDRGRLCEEKALIPNVAGSEKEMTIK